MQDQFVRTILKDIIHSLREKLFKMDIQTTALAFGSPEDKQVIDFKKEEPADLQKQVQEVQMQRNLERQRFAVDVMIENVSNRIKVL